MLQLNRDKDWIAEFGILSQIKIIQGDGKNREYLAYDLISYPQSHKNNQKYYIHTCINFSVANFYSIIGNAYEIVKVGNTDYDC